MSDKGKKSTGSTGSGGLQRAGAQKRGVKTSASSTDKNKQGQPSKLDTGAAAASAAKQSEGSRSKSRIDDVMSPSLSGPSAAELQMSGMPGSLRNVASPTVGDMGAALDRDRAMEAALQKAPETDKKSGKK